MTDDRDRTEDQQAAPWLENIAHDQLINETRIRLDAANEAAAAAELAQVHAASAGLPPAVARPPITRRHYLALRVSALATVAAGLVLYVLSATAWHFRGRGLVPVDRLLTDMSLRMERLDAELAIADGVAFSDRLSARSVRAEDAVDNALHFLAPYAPARRRRRLAAIPEQHAVARWQCTGCETWGSTADAVCACCGMNGPGRT